MGARAYRLEAEPRRHYESEGLLGSSLAGQRRRQLTTPDGYYSLAQPVKTYPKPTTIPYRGGVLYRGGMFCQKAEGDIPGFKTSSLAV